MLRLIPFFLSLYSLIKTHFHRMYDFLLLHWGIVCERGLHRYFSDNILLLSFWTKKKYI